MRQLSRLTKKRYYVYAAIDVERNELILMRVYMTRNYLTTKSFVKEVLSFARISLNSLLIELLVEALKSLGLDFEHQTFR